jgi:hypothetical protein
VPAPSPLRRRNERRSTVADADTTQSDRVRGLSLRSRLISMPRAVL